MDTKMNMDQKRQTKIVATLGPASRSPKIIADMIKAGVNMFRLNFSHGTHADHAAAVEIIRGIEKKSGRPIAIMADLQGPKFRIGVFKNGSVALKKNQKIIFDLNAAPGDETRVNLPHPEVLKVLNKGGLIFLDDGKVRVEIKKKGKGFVEGIVQAGSKLSDKKGFNVPGAIIPVPALTEKDKKDLKAALGMGVDWIAQSFVQTQADAVYAKKMIGGKAALMVKLEKPSALTHLHAIMEIADGAMLARGDLGVEIPPEDVPSAQKRVVRYLRECGKPVVVATQMLESMISAPRPTRAEASDVATAVYDGADAVMLSAETASGEYPLASIQMMAKICARTESDETYINLMQDSHPDSINEPSDAITTAAYYVAQDVGAAAIVTYTMSGSTALRMARQRPYIPVLCLTPRLNVARRMAVSYGVHAVHAPEIQGEFSGPVPHANRILKAEGLAKKSQRFVMTAGVPFNTVGSTNLLRIAEVE
jgi:pyruvate kinase